MPIAFVASLILAQTGAANPFVDPMFSDNMVLQREQADPVWGWTTPGAKVTVSIGGKNATAVADADGVWMTRLTPFRAGGSYTLTVTGPSSASFSNVTFGDVWLCSGQSNMQFGVGNLKNGGADEIAAANFPDIRLCWIPNNIAADPAQLTQTSWEVCTPSNLAQDGNWGGFSAVAYFFGKQLHQDLKVPIGLIHSSWGGTIAEAWASEDSLRGKLPEFDKAIDDMKLSAHQTGTYAQKLTDWYLKYDPGTGSNTPWSTTDLTDTDWLTMQVPNYVQKSGLAGFDNQQSVFWLRKKVDLPADANLDSVVLHFMADDNDATWVNGTFVGATDGYNVPRAYKIPAGVLRAGTNTIAVRVTDTNSPGGIYGDPGSAYLEFPGQPSASLAGDWKVKLGTAITDQNPLPITFGQNPNLPTVLYNGMIYPLAPYGIKGAIWYQGESNVGRARQYQTLLPTMIESWRDRFQEGPFPFLIVQLAGFMHPPAQPAEDGWSELREAQMIASTSTPNAGIATAIDIGEQDDIHPKNKQEVGRRLALVAESVAYGRHVEFSGPRYQGLSAGKGSLRVSFQYAHGLKTSDGQPPRGFAIAGEDHVWHWATAQIKGSSVEVSSPDVPKPVVVRYGWASYLDLNLQNGAGLPAFPFRTDGATPQ